MRRLPAATLAIVFAASLMAGATGCNFEESPEAKVIRSVKFAKRVLEEPGRNELASASYQSMMEMGGDALDYIAANIGEQDDLAPFVRGAPSERWCGVIGPGPENHTYLIEGYGEDLEKPVVTESVVVAPMPFR